MKKEIFIPYLIFSSIVIGCFLILAKDENGFYVLALGLLSFALLYVYDGARSVHRKKTYLESIELFALGGISLILFCKAYLLLFLGIHKVYLFFCFLILGTSIVRIYKAFGGIRGSGTHEYVRLNLYGLLILCLVSDMYSKVAETQFIYLESAILLGVVATLFYILVAVAFERVQSRSNKDYLSLDVSKSYWLLFGYVLIIGYSLLLEFGYADKVDFKRRPKDYVELFYKAESGKEKPVKGKYQFQVYEEGRNEFVKRYWDKRK